LDLLVGLSRLLDIPNHKQTGRDSVRRYLDIIGAHQVIGVIHTKGAVGEQGVLGQLGERFGQV